MRRLFACLAIWMLLSTDAARAQSNAKGPATPGGSDQSGVVKGRAVGIDLSDTLEIVIDTDDGMVKLSALPTQIANLLPGDIVSFRYRSYGGHLWVELAPPGTPGLPKIDPDSLGQTGIATGQLTSIDKGLGQIVVVGRAFRSHPQMLENLLPGQFVEVTYVQFGKAYGAVAIKPIGSQAPPPVPGAPTPSAPAMGGSGTR
jgi:hypothetical protein